VVLGATRIDERLGWFQLGFTPTALARAAAYPSSAMALLVDQPKLTPRHLAVLGIWQRFLGRISPEAIALELHFEVAEVTRLLSDLAARGYVARPIS
jgi:DNA-binding MarR family transcriptional regulator